MEYTTGTEILLAEEVRRHVEREKAFVYSLDPVQSVDYVKYKYEEMMRVYKAVGYICEE